jgi:plastocyanin
MNKAIIAVVAVVVIAGGAFLLMKQSGNKDANSSSSQTSSSSSAQKSDVTAKTAPPADTSVASAPVDIIANDTSASPDAITVKKGDTITINFKVSSAGTYHGGLEFKSTDPAVDSGPIAQGSTGKVTFTATKSFKFTPYWYQSSVQKDYFVTVNVQ